MMSLDSSSHRGARADYLSELLRLYFPLHFFAVFRAHELHNVEPFIGLLEPPVLDLGCGDGLISNLLFGRPLESMGSIRPSRQSSPRAGAAPTPPR